MRTVMKDASNPHSNTDERTAIDKEIFRPTRRLLSQKGGQRWTHLGRYASVSIKGKVENVVLTYQRRNTRTLDLVSPARLLRQWLRCCRPS